jgi:hypothetical protein
MIYQFSYFRIRLVSWLNLNAIKGHKLYSEFISSFVSYCSSHLLEYRPIGLFK